LILCRSQPAGDLLVLRIDRQQAGSYSWFFP